MFQQRIAVNSLFGNYGVNRNNGDVAFGDDDDTTDSVFNKILTQTKTGHEIDKNQKIEIFLENPEVYKQARQYEFENRMIRLRNILKLEFKDYLDHGYTQEEAEKMMMQKFEKLKKQEIENVNYLFPFPESFGKI